MPIRKLRSVIIDSFGCLESKDLLTNATKRLENAMILVKARRSKDVD